MASTSINSSGILNCPEIRRGSYGAQLGDTCGQCLQLFNEVHVLLNLVRHMIRTYHDLSTSYN